MAKAAGWLVAAALVAYVFGACGGDDDAPPGPTTAAVSPQATSTAPAASTTATPASIPTLTAEQAALLAGLPAAEELGTGWEEQSRGPTTPTESTLCGETVTFTNADVLAAYLNLEAGHAFVIVGVSRRSTDESLDQLREVLAGCDELTSVAPGQPPAVYTVEPVEFDRYGDDTLALKVTTQLEGSPQPSEGYFVVIRDGELELAVADIFLVTADPEQTKTIVAAAHEALQRIE